eukprot:14013472-Alexandrium_andersonii.AAC.1
MLEPSPKKPKANVDPEEPAAAPEFKDISSMRNRAYTSMKDHARNAKTLLLQQLEAVREEITNP